MAVEDHLVEDFKIFNNIACAPRVNITMYPEAELPEIMTAKGGSITIKNNHRNAGISGLLLSLDKGEYSFFFNGKKLKGSKRMETLWELSLPKGSKGILKVEKQ